MSIFSTCKGLNESTDAYDSLDTLEEGVFKYTASMIPVAARNTTEGTKYLVEFDMLQKLASHNNEGIVEAYNSVVEENSIDSDDLYVFVSENTMDLISESTSKASYINYQINDLSDNGVNILKCDTNS